MSCDTNQVDELQAANLFDLYDRVAALESNAGIVTDPGTPTTSVNPVWLNAADYGVLPENTNNHQAMTDAIEASKAIGHRQVYVPQGRYLVEEPIDFSGVRIQGFHQNSVQFMSTVAANGLFYNQGTDGTGILENLSLYKQAGLSGGIAVDLTTSSNTQSPDLFRLSNLRITTNSADPFQGTWSRCINVYGVNRTSPPGIRGGIIEHIEAFNATGPFVVCHGITNLRINTLKCFKGGAPLGSNAGLWIGGTSSVQANDVQATGLRLTGSLNVTNTVWSSFQGRIFGTVSVGSGTNSNVVTSVA